MHEILARGYKNRQSLRRGCRGVLSHPIFQSRATPSPSSATEWCLAQDQTPSLKLPVSNDWSRRDSQCLAPCFRQDSSKNPTQLQSSPGLHLRAGCNFLIVQLFPLPDAAPLTHLLVSLPKASPSHPWKNFLMYRFQALHLFHWEPKLYLLLQKVVLGRKRNWDFRAGSLACCLTMETLSLMVCGVPVVPRVQWWHHC